MFAYLNFYSKPTVKVSQSITTNIFEISRGCNNWSSTKFLLNFLIASLLQYYDKSNMFSLADKIEHEYQSKVIFSYILFFTQV